jgi:SET domain-containing protein 6
MHSRSERFSSIFILDTTLKVSSELVSFARLLLMPPSEWEKTQQKGKFPKPKAEEQIVGVTKDVLKKRIAEYTTTLEVRAHFAMPCTK